MTRQHRRLSVIVSGVAWMLGMSAALCMFAAPALAAEEEARVLILNTADPYLPGHMVIENAMRVRLAGDTTRQVTYFFESLDAYRFPIQAMEPELVALLSKKYSALRIDVVVAVSRPAIEFFERHGERLWPGARVVYNAFSVEYPGPVTFPPNVTGVVGYQAVADTIALALRLRPNPRRIVVVSGASDADRSAAQLAQSALSDSTKQVPVEFLSGLPLQELLVRVAAVPPDAVIICLTQYRDRDNRPYTPREVARAISKISAAPVFGYYETYLGFGIAAGQMESYEDEGRLLAEQVLAALAGAPSDPSRVLLKTPNRCMADARALQRWSLDELRLPDGCEVRFAEQSVWRQYGWPIAVALAIIAGEMALIVALLTQRRRRRVAEAELRERLSELTHITRRVSMGELSASIAHEIKQPLTSIHLNASAGAMMLGAEPPQLDEMADILDDIKSDGQRAIDIIDRIRNMVRKVEVDMRSLDLNEAIQQIIKVLASEAAVRGVFVEVELEPGLPRVSADSVQLQQVILNLALNAMDAIHDLPIDKRLLTIRSRRANDREAEVSVTDSGAGIAEESIRSIFEPFVTTKPGGMGMGLAISRTIIEAHGGEIHAENSSAGGAVFKFTLPLISDKTPAEAFPINRGEDTIRAF
jgi:signal transduction histidine kinase